MKSSASELGLTLYEPNTAKIGALGIESFTLGLHLGAERLQTPGSLAKIPGLPGLPLY